VAARACDRPGWRSRWATDPALMSGPGGRKSLARRAYRDLLAVAPQRLAGLIVLLCDGLNSPLMAGMRQPIAAHEWLRVYHLSTYAPDLGPEGLWSILGRRFLSNVAFAELEPLIRMVGHGLRAISYRPDFIEVCLGGTEVSLTTGWTRLRHHEFKISKKPT
jgi:hypothetical protein